MNKDNTISIQEVRKNPLGFLEQINNGKTLTVIYHSKPFTTVTSADSKTIQQSKSTNQLLKYARRAHESATLTHDPNKSYRELYAEGMAKKYGIS